MKKIVPRTRFGRWFALAATLWCAAMLSGRARAIVFEFNYLDDGGEGFFDSVLGDDRRAALEYAGSIWGSLIRSAYEGETVTVRASFDEDPNLLGEASSDLYYGNFGSTHPQYRSDTHFAKALASHLNRGDVEPGRHDIDISFGIVNDFFYGIEGSPGASQYDFISLALHEILHGLGWFDSMRANGSYGLFGDGAYDPDDDVSGFALAYDRYLTLGPNGTPLLDLSQSQRSAALVSDNVFWNGPSGILGNGGTPPKIFAPTMFVDGSSIGHINDATYNGAIMTSTQPPGVVWRTPFIVERGMLRDLGWDITLASATHTWTGLGADNLWTTRENWSGNQVPRGGDSVVFGPSAQTDVMVHYGGTTGAPERTQFLGSLTFALGAPSYTLRFRSWTETHFQDAGVVTASPNPQTIILESYEDDTTVGRPPLSTEFGAEMTFSVNARAGGAMYRLRGGVTSIEGIPPPHGTFYFLRHPGAHITFNDNSNAATATFEVEGGSGDGGPNAQVTFRHNSSAGEANFRTKGGRLGVSLPLGNVAVGLGGQVRFENTSKAGDATFHNEGQTEHFNGAGGFTVFTDSSTAENAEIHNHGATFTNGIGGAAYFYDNSTAGAASITNHADGSNFGNIAARTVFQDFSNAGTATIENEGSPRQAADPGLTEFRNNSSAANATINNRGYITVGDVAGRTIFYDSATAANATLRTFDGYSDHGRIEFHDQSTAASARIFIENEPLNSATAGGYLNFFDNSTAAQSQITLRADSNAIVYFYNNATAASAQIVQENGAGNIAFWGNSTAANATFSIGESAGVTFYDQTTAPNANFSLAHRARLSFVNSSSAGQSQIVAAGGSTYTPGAQAQISFLGENVTAANSTILVNGAADPLASRALVTFTSGAHAGNATIIANSGTNGGDGGEIGFDSGATGDTAQLVAHAGAKVDFHSQRIYGNGSTTVGSIAGAGTFILRGSELITGTRNTPITTVTGQIVDGSGYSGGRLTKVGAGTLTLAGTNTYSGLTTVAAGTLRVDGSLAGDVLVENGARLEGTGSFARAPTVNPGGVFAPGTSPGTITVGGLTMMPAATLEFEIGEPARDRIMVTSNGNITLDGILNISLLDGFMPALGQSFPMFEGAIGSIIGAFDTFLAPTFNGLTFDVVQTAGSVLLQVGEATLLPGDFNGDGAVNAADYVVWRKSDGTQDGYNLWRANFGRTAGSGSGATAGWAPLDGWSSSAVPEPSSAVLIIIGLLSALSATRRRTHGHGTGRLNDHE